MEVAAVVTAFFLFLSFVSFMIGGEPETTTAQASEPVFNNDLVIYSPQVFETVIRDVLNVFMETQAQQNEQQLKMFQSHIETMSNINSFHFLTFGFSVAVITTVVICGLGYFFLSNNPNINMGEVGNNIYTQIINQYTNIANQAYQTINRLFGFNNLEMPLAHAELVNHNNINVDPVIVELLANNVVDNVYNQEIEILLNDVLNERLLAYVMNPANIDVTNAHIIGEFLLHNNGIM